MQVNIVSPGLVVPLLRNATLRSLREWVRAALCDSIIYWLTWRKLGLLAGSLFAS